MERRIDRSLEIELARQTPVQYSSPVIIFLRTHIRSMLAQDAYDLDASISRRYVQRGRAIFGPRVYVCTMLEQHTYEFDTSTVCRSVQRGPPFLVLRTHIRAVLKQHAYSFDAPIFRCYVQRDVSSNRLRYNISNWQFDWN